MSLLLAIGRSQKYLRDGFFDLNHLHGRIVAFCCADQLIRLARRLWNPEAISDREYKLHGSGERNSVAGRHVDRAHAIARAKGGTDGFSYAFSSAAFASGRNERAPRTCL